MAYLRCTKCGSKALVAASQCPKCAHPFNLLDARGERAKLKRCRSCGIMHRVDAQCHWCGDVKGTGFSLASLSSLRVDRSVWRTAAAVALMVTAAGGVWRLAPQLKEAVGTSRSLVSIAAPLPTTGDARGTPTGNGVVAAPSMASATPTAPSDSTGGSVASAIPAAGMPDEIQWTPAVARTWVNVRSDASRGGQVVGVIKPAARAMLGTGRAGWRQVRSPDISGWADPRLFEPDSLRTRGGP
jgi:hypothetical protein